MLLPSLHSLVPIIGTMLIIWYSNKDEIITKILLLVLVGVIAAVKEVSAYVVDELDVLVASVAFTTCSTAPAGLDTGVVRAR